MYKQDKKSISELELEPELELELEFELESDIKLESNSVYKNIKVNDTDIEVLEKKVSFFPPHLLNEKPKPKPIKNQVQPSLNYMKPKVQEQVLSRVIPQNMVIRPMAQMRGSGRRGIGMRMF